MCLQLRNHGFYDYWTAGINYHPSLPLSFSYRLVLAPLAAPIMNLSSSSVASLWPRTFRQIGALLFGQCFLLNGLFLLYSHMVHFQSQSNYTHDFTWRQTESLSRVEREHCESYGVLWLPCLSAFPFKERGGIYIFVVFKWSGFGQGHF